MEPSEAGAARPVTAPADGQESFPRPPAAGNGVITVPAQTIAQVRPVTQCP